MLPYQFDIVKEQKEAEKLWERFSPKRSLFDDWQVRSCFALTPPMEFFFIVGSVQGKPIGLLPLQKNLEKGQYEFFGGPFMEENRVFLDYGHDDAIPQFYASVPTPARLEYISGDDPFTTKLPLLDQKYTLPLTGMKKADDYLEQCLSGKSRSTMRRKLAKIQELGITIRENILGDLDDLIRLNIKRHGADSSFHLPRRKEVFEKLFHTPTATPHLLTFLQGNDVVAVSFCLHYKTTFVYLNAGVDNEKIPNLNSYVIFQNIERAIAAGAEVFDACIGDYGWKERWHFQKTPQYQYGK